jgi:site-specific recombinase XerD
MLAEVAHKWLVMKEATGTAPLTVTRYRRALDRFVGDMGGDGVPLEAVTPLDFEEWVTGLRQPDGRRYKTTSLKTTIAPVRAFYAWCFARRLVDDDPTLGVDLARPAKGPPKRLPREAVTRILAAAPHRERTQITLMVCYGLRLAELANLRVEDWDRDRDLLTVAGKGRRTRVLPLAGEALHELRGWVDYGLRATSGPMWPSPERPGEPLGAGWVGRRITAVGAAAGYTVHPHLFRHTAASDMIEEGFDLAVVQELLGHASLASTTIYVSAQPEHMRTAFAELRRPYSP